MTRRAASTAFLAAAFLLSSGLFILHAHDRDGSRDGPRDPAPDRPSVRTVFGHTGLSPTDPPVDEDARGSVSIFERGERQAVHVHVKNLEPGATYAVCATRGDETAEIGSITTRDSAAAPPPRFAYAKLSGAKEVPPVETDARGFGNFVLNRERTELSYSIFVRGLSGPATAAHLHEGAEGEEGDPVVTLDHETLKGKVEVSEAVLALYAAGRLYVNIHTEANPGGEIRGQVKTFDFFSSWRRRLDGSGSLRLDSKRDDAMPFGVETLSDLAGVGFQVKNADDAVVLSGTLESVKVFGGDPAPEPDPAPGDNGAVVVGIAPDPYGEVNFALPEVHDASFLRGDANDDRRIDISDPVTILLYLFAGGSAPYCMDAADVDDNGAIDISDAVRSLESQFLGRSAAAPPSTRAGFDRSPDRLFCDAITD